MPDYSQQLNQDRAQEKKKIKKKVKKPTSQVSQILGVEFLIIGMIALTNDGLDWLGADLLLFRMIDLTTGGILGLWCLMRLKKFPSVRFGGTFLIELMPFLGDFSPTWTIFIISLYISQNKSNKNE